MKAVGATYHIFDFFLPEWRVQAKTVEYQKNGMKLKQRLSLLVALVQKYTRPITRLTFICIPSTSSTAMKTL